MGLVTLPLDSGPKLAVGKWTGEPGELVCLRELAEKETLYAALS